MWTRVCFVLYFFFSAFLHVSVLFDSQSKGFVRTAHGLGIDDTLIRVPTVWLNPLNLPLCLSSPNAITASDTAHLTDIINLDLNMFNKFCEAYAWTYELALGIKDENSYLLQGERHILTCLCRVHSDRFNRRLIHALSCNYSRAKKK